MQILIDNVTTADQFREVCEVRRKVFEKEWKKEIPFLALDTTDKAWHLVARTGELGLSVAALSVVDTTAEHELHRKYALHFPDNARVGRLTQLAVLSPFRGMGIPHQLIREAMQRIVQPQNFDFTWLLFDASRAESCTLVADFDYSASAYVLQTEHGLCRVLTRDERRRSGGRNRSKHMDDTTEDTRTYIAVVNDEEQYSIWPAHKPLPAGWQNTGKSGTKKECLDYIATVWTDMRPLSLRRQMAAADFRL